MPQKLHAENLIALFILLVAMLLPIILSIATSVHGSGSIVPADLSKNISWPYHTYQTVNFNPPVVAISGEPSPDAHLFFAPNGNTAHQKSPIITSATGELIWNGPLSNAFGFGPQKFRGEDVLVYWNGTSFPEPVGRGHGRIHILNRHYEEIANVSLPGNFVDLVEGQEFESNLDLHEMYLTEKGTILALGNNVTRMDLRSVGGEEEGWVVEAQVYEIDVETNEILFCWKSLDHLDELPLSASVYPLGSEGYDGSAQSKAWGYFHINSVAPLGDGYILSSRYLSSAIALDRSGNVLWRVQGIDGNGFTLGPDADFRYQHYIRAIEQTSNPDHIITISMHDNHNCPIDNNTVPASGKFLHIDLQTKHVSLLPNHPRFLNSSGPIFPTSQGSFERVGGRLTPNTTFLHNNDQTETNYLACHGGIPVLEEFSPQGQILATYQVGYATKRPGGGFFTVGRDTISYRGFKQTWVGCPKSRPKVVVEVSNGGGGYEMKQKQKMKMKNEKKTTTKVYVSWNGATEVEGWEVFGGMERGDVKRYLKTVENGGFETVVELEEEDVKFVKLRAVLKKDSQSSSSSSSSYGGKGKGCEVVESEVVAISSQ